MVGDKEVIGILLRKLLRAGISRRRAARRFPAHAGAGGMPQAAGRQDQPTPQRVREHAAGDSFPPADDPCHGAVRQRADQHRAADPARACKLPRTTRKWKRPASGEVLELRPTDLSEETARRRYRVFKEQTWDALQSLKDLYHYHFVNAEGPIEEVEANILKELQYQSSLELEPRTYDRLSPLPLAEEIILHARQELVRRLDSYELEHTDLFVRTVDIIKTKFMPIIARHALSGRAIVNSEDPIFDDPLALSMLIDIFSERGFHAVVDKHIQQIPERVDLQTGQIHGRTKAVYRIQINFKGSEIRRG